MPASTKNEITVGIELEGFFRATHGNGHLRLDRYVADETRFRGSQGGIVTIDTAVDQPELITGIHNNPADAAAEIMEMFMKFHEEFPCVRPHFVPIRPSALRFPGQSPWAEKPRYRALFEAAKNEAGRNWGGIRKFVDVSATHMHVGVDPLSPEGVSVMNYFGNAGPRIARQVAQRFNIDNEGHLAVWRRWARADRFPSWKRWFASPDDLLSFVMSIPRFVVNRGNDVWEAATTADGMSRFDCPIDTGTIWWLVRPRAHQETIELRFLPSMPPEYLPEALGEIYAVVQHLVREAPLCGVARDSAETRRVFRECHEISKFMPPKPLLRREWNDLVVR